MSDAYDKIDRFLRNELDDTAYAEYSAALDVLFIENFMAGYEDGLSRQLATEGLEGEQR